MTSLRFPEQVSAAVRAAVVNFITLVFGQLTLVPEKEDMIVSVCISLGKLLIGPASEADSSVRRKIYNALSKTMKGCIRSLPADDYTMITEGIQRGLFDRDRATRLSAG